MAWLVNGVRVPEEFVREEFQRLARDPHRSTIADLNGDGRSDIAVATGGLRVYINNGDGTFTLESIVACPGDQECIVSSVAVGDFDGDGIPDLAVSATDGYFVSVLRGKGDGTFMQPFLFGTPDPEQLIVGNFFGHNKADMAVASSGGMTVMENTSRAISIGHLPE